MPVDPRPARQHRVLQPSPREPGPRRPPVAAVHPLPRQAAPPRLRGVDHQQQAVPHGIRGAVPGDDRARRRGDDLRDRAGHPAREARCPPHAGPDRRQRNDHLAVRREHPGVRARAHPRLHLRGRAPVAADAGPDRPTRGREPRDADRIHADRYPARGAARPVRGRAPPPRAAGDRPGHHPARDHHPHHARRGARREQRGLRPDGPRQGPQGEARRLAPHHAQRVAAGRHGHRPPGGRAARGRRAHRDGVRLERRGPLRGRRDPEPRLPDHPVVDPDLRADLPRGEPAGRPELRLSQPADPLLVSEGNSR